MPRTKSVSDTRQQLIFDRNKLISKLEAIGIEEKLASLLKSQEIVDYYEENLAKPAEEFLKEFKTDHFRKQFGLAVSKENLMLSLKTNIQTNLFSNALSFWFRLDASIEEILNKMLNELFIKRVIDLLAYEIDAFAYDLLEKEEDTLPEDTSVDDSEKTEFPFNNPFKVSQDKRE